jgi:hypothetical protein
LSKTDKTKPWRVQARDTLVAVHDHSDGVCNLPTMEEWVAQDLMRRWSRHDCVWQPRNWHTDVTFSRYSGEKDWIKKSKTRKHKDWKDNYDRQE